MHVGDETIDLAGVGQRDHSWGTRDWWSAEWMWSAGHLQDGTRLHGVEFRTPGSPADRRRLHPAAERRRSSSSTPWPPSEQAGADGLITAARISYGDLGVSVQPLAFGPLLLDRTRRTHLAVPARHVPRSQPTTGAAGVAWVEWNRNASLE